MDPAELRSRVWKRIIFYPPTVLLGVLAGAGALVTAGLALTGPLSTPWPLVGFGSLCTALLAVGLFGTRALTQTERLTHQTMQTMAEEAARARQRKLDDLESRLAADHDPLDEALLRDLRMIYDRFRTDLADLTRPGGDAVWRQQTIEVAGKCERLFNSCVTSLERSLELAAAAQRMNTREMQKQMLTARSRLLGEVQESVRQLAKIIDGVHALGLVRDDEREMARLRQDLNQSLEVARRVEERMRNIDTDLSNDSLEAARPA